MEDGMKKWKVTLGGTMPAIGYAYVEAETAEDAMAAAEVLPTFKIDWDVTGDRPEDGEVLSADEM